jgi:murein DD-endopeptidase MepM/ murein hydrolase activator NlpD
MLRHQHISARALAAACLALALTLVLVGGSGGPAAATEPQPTPSWAPPVSPVLVVRGFDPPAQRWLAGHRGVDLLARPGTRVLAVGAGRVTYAGTLAGRGVVVVDHGSLRTTYEPIAAIVAVGQRVSLGQVLGRVAPGRGHCGEGTCLHLGLKRGETYLDPRLVLGRSRAVLRPW